MLHADFSNDSSLFVTAGRDNLIHVWESETGMLRSTLEGHATDVMHCKVRAGDRQAGEPRSGKGCAVIWNHAEALEPCIRRMRLRGTPSCPQICEDGEVAISGDSEGTVLVWSLADGSCIMRLQGHSSPVLFVDLNADATRALSVDGDGNAFLWYLDAARMFEVGRRAGVTAYLGAGRHGCGGDAGAAHYPTPTGH